MAIHTQKCDKCQRDMKHSDWTIELIYRAKVKGVGARAEPRIAKEFKLDLCYADAVAVERAFMILSAACSSDLRDRMTDAEREEKTQSQAALTELDAGPRATPGPGV